MSPTIPIFQVLCLKTLPFLLLRDPVFRVVQLSFLYFLEISKYGEDTKYDTYLNLRIK